jgi:proteasome activator subunit 4
VSTFASQLGDKGANANSTVQLLEDEPFDVYKPHVEKLIENKDQNKQRAAAELLAGILNGGCFHESQ